MAFILAATGSAVGLGNPRAAFPDPDARLWPDAAEQRLRRPVFVLRLFAAWTSATSLLEPVVEWLEDKLIFNRVGSTIVAGSACWLLGMFERLEGQTIFDLLDFFTANVMLPLYLFTT